MKRRMLAVLMSVAMAVGMMATGGAAKAADSYTNVLGEWTVSDGSMDQIEPGTWKATYSKNSTVQFWAPRLMQEETIPGASEGTYYVVFDVQYDITEEEAGPVERMFMLKETDHPEDYVTLQPGKKTRVKYTVTVDGEGKTSPRVRILPGPYGSLLSDANTEIPAHTITISNTVMVSEEDYFKYIASEEDVRQYYKEKMEKALETADKAVQTYYNNVKSFGDYDDAIIDLMIEGISFEDAVYQAAPADAPVPKFEGVQYKNGSKGTQDVRYVYSIPRSTSIEIEKIGAIICSGAYSIDDDAMVEGADGQNTTEGEVKTLFTQLTNVEEDPNRYYFTVIATDLPSHWPGASIGLKSRAYVTFADDVKPNVYTAIEKVDNKKNEE